MQVAKAEPETKRLRKQAGTWLKGLRARAVGADPGPFARELLSYYDPELYRLLFEVKQ